MTNPIVRAWRRFWLCHKPYAIRWWRGDLCLRRRWHLGDCEGFASEPEPVKWPVLEWSTYNPYAQTFFVQDPAGYAGSAISATPIPGPESS